MAASSDTSLPAVPLKARARLVGIGLLVGLVLGAAGSLYVYFEMRGAVSAAEEQVEVQREAQREQASRNALLTARVGLSRALVELDRRNFGTANEYIEGAADAVQRAEADVLKVDAKALSDMRIDLLGARLDVSADLEAQRSRLLEVGGRLDAMIGG